MSKNRYIRKVNQKVNALVAEMNKGIEQDPMWKGRFVIRQVKKTVSKFSDNSGYNFFWLYRIYDKKSGLAQQQWFNYYELLGHTKGYDLWEFVNNFIIEKSKVWEEDPKPSYNSPSYINKPLPKITELIW